MKKRWLIALAALLIVALAGVFLPQKPASPPMPVYQGKCAEQWIREAQTTSPPELMRAFHMMGSNTTAVALHAYQLRDSVLTKLALRIYTNFPPLLKNHLEPPASAEAMRRGAHWALGSPRAAMPQLMGLLAERNNPARFYILQEAIPPLGPVDKDYTPVFIPLLRDADVKVRLEAGEGLRKIGPGAKAAIPGLTIALKDSSVKMRLSSAWAIWRIDLQTNALSTAINEAVQSSQSSWCYEFCGRCLDEANPADRAFIPVLTNLLGGSNANARVMAARILGKYDLYGREAIPALAKAAENGDPGLRNAALSSLKRIDPEAAAKYQLTLTQTESP